MGLFTKENLVYKKLVEQNQKVISAIGPHEPNIQKILDRGYEYLSKQSEPQEWTDPQCKMFVMNNLVELYEKELITGSENFVYRGTLSMKGQELSAKLKALMKYGHENGFFDDDDVKSQSDYIKEQIAING